jgi:PAS domain S-box-containing protein
MARTPDYVRLAATASRTLVEAAFDSVREAVLIVDTRRKHVPVVLANASARRHLAAGADPQALLESSLYGLLSAVSASMIEGVLGAVPERGDASLTRSLAWRFSLGESTVATELKRLDSSPGQRLVMLTFAIGAFGPELWHIADQLPFNLLVLDSSLNITYANCGAAQSSGVAGSPIGCSALSVAPTSALPREIYQRGLEGCHFHHDAVEYDPPFGPRRRFEIDIQPLRGPAGIVGLIVLTSEVGERRIARTPESVGERHLRALMAHAQDTICVAAADGRLLYVSSGATDPVDHASSDTSYIFDFLAPEDAAALRTDYSQLVCGATSRFTRQHRVRRQDGTYRWMESSYVSGLDNPLIRGVAIFSRDITKRKQAELQLAQREEVFRLAADAVNGVIFEWDLARGFVHRSRGMSEVLGIEPEDLAPVVDAWRERIHPRDLEAVTRQIGLALIQGRGWTTTYRIRDAHGRYRSMLERGLIQRNANGDPVRAIGCCVDVSEIKRLTDLLGEAQRTAQMAGWEYSHSSLELTWTEEMFSIYETTPAEFVASWDSVLAQCTSESRQRFHEAWKRAESADGQIDLELEINTLKNKRIWVRMIGHMEKLEGRLVRAFGSVQNIQAQKLAQIAVENSTRWLKLSMTMAHVHAWRWDKASDAYEFAILDDRRKHLPTTFPTMKAFMSSVHPEDRVAVTRCIEDAFRKRTEQSTEFRVKVSEHGYRSYISIARPLFDAAGEPQGLVGASLDVTRQRGSEAKLRRSEQLLRTTTSNTVDTLLLVDGDLRIRFINRGSGAMGIEELVGREISMLLPESARATVIGKLRHVLETGEPATYEFESRESREPRYFENRAVRVKDEGAATSISISITDITERKRLEQEILDVSSRERHTIGRDLHDGLGQELTGIALMLRSVATRFQHQFPEGVSSINEIVGLVNQSIETARSLARGLLPVRADSGGLPFALRELAGRSRDLHGLEVNFRAEIWPEITLSEASASHLYRIAQEALTNAARHGHASTVEIFLMVAKNTFLLRITDNGVGIASSNKAGSGMGLKIMRYRAGMIGAKIEIGAHTPKGTVVRVTGEQPARPGAIQWSHAIYGGSEYGR